MFNRSEYMKAKWASMSKEDRSKVMSERRKKGVSGQTPEARSKHAQIAARGRWPLKIK